MTESDDKRSGLSPHQRVALPLVGVAVGMLALAYASVPLYRLFCQVTGYGGTTQQAAIAPGPVSERQITIRFDANVDPDLSWRFEPVARTVEVRIGENTLALYRAHNPTTLPITGTASFNVAPAIAGQYFSKIECFCFTEQTLQAGETIEMPVSFFVDPAILDNPDARGIGEITLSYTFHRSEADVGALPATAAQPAGG